MSSRNGSRREVPGTPMEMGLVPNRAWLPR